jgi:hypothetical protein
MNRANGVPSRFRPAASLILPSGRAAGKMPDKSEPPDHSPSPDRRGRRKTVDIEKLFKNAIWWRTPENRERRDEAKTGAEEEKPRMESRADRRIFEALYLNELARTRFQVDPTAETHALFERMCHHDAYSPLRARARAVAITRTFLAKMAQVHRDCPSYWLLKSVSAEHRGPIAVRRGAFPGWRRVARTTERLAAEVDELRVSVEQLESNFVSCHDTPAVFVDRAVYNLYRALEWMEAFPAVPELKKNLNRYRRLDAQNESPGALACALEWLFRNHSVRKLKVIDIHCRIAGIENEFLRQNVAFHEGFGSPAIQRQILRFKKDGRNRALEESLERELASRVYARLEEWPLLSRSEEVRMISDWCAMAEQAIARAPEFFGRSNWLKDTEYKMLDWLLERYTRSAHPDDSSLIGALNKLRQDATAQIDRQAEARSDLERRLSALCSNLEHGIGQIRGSPFLGPVTGPASDDWRVPCDLVECLEALRSTEDELYRTEQEILSLDKTWIGRISRITDTLTSEEP